MKTLIIALVAVAAAWAQERPIITPGQPAYPELVKYLDLTADQMVALSRLQMDFQRYLAQKEARVATVSAEIRDETVRSVVDPNSLGVRYAELEAICREARTKERDTQATARKLMNMAQEAKLKTLEQAYALLPLVVQADVAHLIAAPLTAVAASRMATALPGCKFAAGAPR